MKRGKLSLWGIVILLICLTIFFSCKKTEEVQTSDLTLESTEELLQTEEPPKENFGVTIKPRTPMLPYDDSIIIESLNLLLYKYDDVYYSMKFGEYYTLNDRKKMSLKIYLKNGKIQKI